MSRSKERHIRIVVIDDEPDMLFFAKSFLTMHLPPIVRVHTSSHVNWEEAVPDWEEVAIVIVDLLMPTSGIDILRELKTKHPKIDLIAWTAAPDTVGKELQGENLAVVIPKPDHDALRLYVLRMVGG